MADTSTNETAGSGPDTRIVKYLVAHLREYGLLFALIAIMAFFQIVTGGTLLKPVNITNLFLQNSYIIIMALGMLIVIVGGHIDLSVGSVMGFVGALAAVMMVNYDLPAIVAIPVCLLAGTLIGAAQGYWVAYWSIPSFIVTLAGMLVFRGASLWLLEGQSVGPFPPGFQLLSTGFVPDLLSPLGDAVKSVTGDKRVNGLSIAVGFVAVIVIVWTGMRTRLKIKTYGVEGEPKAFFIARNVIVGGAILFLLYKLSTFRGLPNVLVTMGILTMIYAFITERTTLGRRIYALGGNVKAAKLSGVATERLTFLTFVNMGFLAALAGLIFARA